VPQVYILPEIILTVETDMPWTSIPFELRDPAGNVFVEGVLQRGRPFPLRDFGTNSPYVFVVKEGGTVPENASVQIQTMGGTVIFTQPLVSNNEENTTLELLEDLEYYRGIMRAEDERARRQLEAEMLAMEAAKNAGNQDVSQQQPHSEGTTTPSNGTHQVPTSQLASAPKPTSQHVAYASASTREQRVPGHVATALATTSDSYTADAVQGIAAQPATQKEYAPLASANQSTAAANGANDTEHAKGAQPMAQSHLATHAQAVGSNGAGDVQNTIQPVTAQSAVVIQNTPSYTANTAREMENTAAATSALPSGSADAVHASSRQEPSAKNTTSGQNAITPKADESTAAKSHAAASLADVYFAFDRADLDADNLNLLGGVIQWLKENPEAHLEIQAHADSRGSHVYNMNLSQRRANMVLDALAGAGIDPSRLKAVGYGETRPINHCIDGVPCSNSDHALNRRTTFVPVYPS
jgi:outer membrane protein OmpA-like peptidoglycan-associated protein